MKYILKYTIAVLCISFGVSTLLHAQEGKQDMERKMDELKSKKVAYFTEKINLDAETAQLFWPLYNEYDAKKMQYHQQFRGIMMKMHMAKESKSEMTDEDYTLLADAMIKLKVSQAKLQEKYHEKYKKILSPEQLVKFYRAEEQFGKDMLRRMHGRGMRGDHSGGDE